MEMAGIDQIQTQIMGIPELVVLDVCGDGFVEALQAGCDTFVTSDIKYNQFWDAHDLGMNLIDAGHFQTENPVVAVLADKIAAAFPEIEVKISETHGDCMKYY